MTDTVRDRGIDFTVDQNNLYREEVITDLKVASIHRLIPMKSDGTEDPDRKPKFVGHTQLMTPEGPLPIQSELTANNLKEAFEIFPQAMSTALEKVIEQIQRMQQQPAERDDSRIIIPR